MNWQGPALCSGPQRLVHVLIWTSKEKAVAGNQRPWAFTCPPPRLDVNCLLEIVAWGMRKGEVVWRISDSMPCTLKMSFRNCTSIVTAEGAIGTENISRGLVRPINTSWSLCPAQQTLFADLWRCKAGHYCSAATDDGEEGRMALVTSASSRPGSRDSWSQVQIQVQTLVWSLLPAAGKSQT